MASVIPPGNAAARSFNDDSSPDSRLTSDLKVSVNAQVLPGASLDWFYRILQLCSSVRGELKSADAWPRFQAVQGQNRDLIWAGLSRVRIHIVDPRPYKNRFDRILKGVLRVDNPSTFLREQVASKEPFAIWLSQQGQLFTADRILSDSVGARVHSVSRFVSDEPFLLDDDDTEVLRLSDFGLEIKPLVRKVSVWAAKSAAVFHEALDTFTEVDPETALYSNYLIRARMKARVLDTHTFDSGDQKQISLLERARTTILENLREVRYGMARTEAKPYVQLGSTDSFLIQAADIAAGIVSRMLETRTLVAVVSAFEYVTYNGRRLSLSDAEELMRVDVSRD